MSFQGLPNQVANITDIPLMGTYVLDPYPARFFCTLQVGRLLSTYSFPQ